MIYSSVKPIELKEIKRFASAYGFPPIEELFHVFREINGGKPIDFIFYYSDNGELIENKIYRMLSFKTEHRHNIEEGMEVIGDISGNVIPLACDENDNYICYINEEDNEKIVFYNTETCEFYDVYTESKEFCTASLFFEIIAP